MWGVRYEEQPMSAMPKATTPQNKPETVEERFRRLATIWRDETAHFSSTKVSDNHPAYKEIISMGWDVVPFLLHEVEATHEHWFTALEAITGINPMPPEARGHIAKIAEAWVKWGR